MRTEYNTIVIGSGLAGLTAVEVLEGNAFQTWIPVKNAVLFVSMISSYIFASKVAKEEK